MGINEKNFNGVEISTVPTIAQQQLLMMIVDELKAVTFLLKEQGKKPKSKNIPETINEKAKKKGFISRFFHK